MADDPADWSRPRVAAGVLFFDEEDRILLVKPTYKDGWDIPGGYVNAGETPREAATREVKEELGLNTDLGEALVVDWAPHPAEGDKLLLVFDGGLLSLAVRTAIRLENELSEYGFFDLADSLEMLAPRLSRRVNEAHASRGALACRYLEHGQLLRVSE